MIEILKVQGQEDESRLAREAVAYLKYRQDGSYGEHKKHYGIAIRAMLEKYGAEAGEA